MGVVVGAMGEGDGTSPGTHTCVPRDGGWKRGGRALVGAGRGRTRSEGVNGKRDVLEARCTASTGRRGRERAAAVCGQIANPPLPNEYEMQDGLCHVSKFFHEYPVMTQRNNRGPPSLPGPFPGSCTVT